MTRHISERTLARFGQGDLSTRRSLRIRAHLARCARCSEVNHDLAGVTTLLADVQPPPIPEHLSARIHTALAAEAMKRAALTAAASSAGAETAGAAAPDAPASRPGERSARHERRQALGRSQPRSFRLSSPVALRTMAATAAAVVLAGGGYEIAMHAGGSGQPSGTVSGPAAAGSTAPNPARAAPYSGADGLSSPAPRLNYKYAGREGTVTAVATDTNYMPTTLSAQVSATLKQNPASGTGRAGSSALHSSTARGTAGSVPAVGGVPLSSLQDCVTGLAPGQQVLLVDVAKYQGMRATVIVTRTSPGRPEQVWVVGTDCSRTSSDLLTHTTLAATG